MQQKGELFNGNAGTKRRKADRPSPGELDHHHTENIRQRWSYDPTTLVGEVEFDFSETLFMDSAGIGLLIGRYQMMQAFHGRVLISHVNEQIERILELSGIEKYIRLEKEETR